MAESQTVYEYTDAHGGTHRVSSLSQVPKDRLQHMLVIGADEPKTQAGAQAAGPSGPAPKVIPTQVYAVSGALLLVGLYSKRFLLRVFCILAAFLYFFYSGYDVFMGSKYAHVQERTPRHVQAPPADDE
ncbi:MAG: hypothetical protein KGL53_12945 [Elusimicrobia bacterium]|nr:hypothetical protein [Elusimicrobiota bacterium]